MMKKISKRLLQIIVASFCFFLQTIVHSQDVGIGTLTPDYRLHIYDVNSSILKLENSTPLANTVAADLIFKTGAWYTGAIKTIGTGSNVARLGMFTFAQSTPGGLKERLSITDDGLVGIGTSTPGYLLDVNGRMRIKYNGISPGLWLSNSSNIDEAFIGMTGNEIVGFYGVDAGWNLVMNTTNGRVGVGTINPLNPLDVFTDLQLIGGNFVNNYAVGTPVAVRCEATSSSAGIGVEAIGRTIGVDANAKIVGSGSRYGIITEGKNGTGSNYGAYCDAFGGTGTYGIYASGSGGTVNYAGFFAGDVFTSGAYLPSDRKLKSEILPLHNSLFLISQLKPSKYTYKTREYNQMQLPEGIQYGLIADEVMQILPGVVKNTIQPARYENAGDTSGSKLSDELEFNAINYTAMIPILIGAVQEQQKQIEQQQQIISDQQNQIDELKSLVNNLKN